MDFATIEARLQKTKRASQQLAILPLEKRNAVLKAVAEKLKSQEAQILAANSEDCSRLKDSPEKANSAFLDRLRLSPHRLTQMIRSLQDVLLAPDPIGEIVEQRVLENRLKVHKQRAPLGVILMIFESRPNVITEAFSLALKSGNALILRGGSESRSTSAALYEAIGEALEAQGVATEALWGISDPDRALVQFLMSQNRWIDVLVPRGGEGLIDYVVQNSKIPIIKNDRGLCHIYVHEDADEKMVLDIVTNAKTQRPGVCNAMETLLIHEKVASKYLPRLRDHLAIHSLKWFVCERSLKILGASEQVQRALDESWDTEYLDLIMNCRVVDSQAEAQEHIFRHGSHHSEAILTASEDAAKKFQAEVDAAVVYWNASTRFTDGFALGLGGELGISTQKLHVRGPLGLRELTSARWIITGTGQTRS